MNEVNRELAEKLVGEINLPASTLFWADDEELTDIGVTPEQISAMHWLNENPPAESKDAEIAAAIARIENRNYSNADLDLMVAAGLAYQIGDVADQSSGAGIVFFTAANSSQYTDNYEEAFVTRG